MELRKEMLIAASLAKECLFMIESTIIELKKIMKTS